MSEMDGLDDEIREHIRLETEDNIARGMPPGEARRAALRKFGNIGQVKEDTRAVWICGWLESLFPDVRYALRGFGKAPLFAATVICTIGLALGLNTTLFTIFDAYVLRPFAIRDPYSLYRFNWSSKGEQFHAFTPAEYADFRRADTVFSEVLGSSFVVTRVNGFPVVGEQVSDNYFQMLGARVTHGRPLLPGDEGVTVLSDAAWRSKFAASPEILGTRLSVAGGVYEVAGIAAPEFSGVSQIVSDLWIPLRESGPGAPQRINVIGRLRGGVSPKQAESALLAWAKQETADRKEPQRAIRAELESGATSMHITPEILAVFSPLLVAFALVLVIACANVANMMLARAMARQREIGVRLSLGAGRGRLIRQLLTESLMLAFPSALAGLAISQASLRFTERLMFATAPSVWLQLIHFFKLETDYRVFLFILLAAAASTLLFGLAPAIQATRPGLYYATRGDFSSDARPSRLRNGLVVIQVAVCVFLLICSGILVRSTKKMQESDVRLVTANVIDLRLRSDTVDPKIGDRLRREPGVESVATAWRAPLYGPLWWIPVASGRSFERVGFDFVSPEYFDVFRIPILRGRNFTAEEGRSEAAVAIVSELTAARFWPGADAVGQTIRIAPNPAADGWKKLPAYHSAIVIGVARDVMTGGPSNGLDATCFYFPTAAGGAKNQALLVRVRNDSDATRRQLEAAIAGVSSDSISTMIPEDQVLAFQVYPFRAASWIGSLLGGIALILALSGIYGVLAYLVSQRTKEIGIRIALGASPLGVVGLILKKSLGLAAVGIAIGAACALGVSRLFASEFENVNTYDALAYSTAIALAVMAVMAGGYFPSRRAASVDPVTALRCD